MSEPPKKKPAVRCIWCHRKAAPLKSITVTTWDRFALRRTENTFMVHPKHEDDFRAFVRYFDRYGRTFLALLLGLTLALIGIAVVGSVLDLSESTLLFLTGVVMAIMGGVLVAFPFCTPETVRMMGMRATTRLGRVLGAVQIALGAVFAVIALVL